MYIKEFNRNHVLLLAVITQIYFGVLVPFVCLLGLEVSSSYYSFSSFSNSSLYTILGCNLISLIILVALLSRLPPKIHMKALNIKLFNWLCIIYFLYNINNSLELSRVDIKTNANFFSSALSTIVVAYCGAILVACENIKKHTLLFTLMFVFLVSKGEREYLALILIALVCRYSISLATIRSCVILCGSLVLALLFKGLTLMIKDPAAIASIDGEYLGALFRILLNDSLNVTGLFSSYLDGHAPDYRVASVFWPVQLEELFDPSAKSNSYIASSFYANLKTGVGFSGMLDFWLNFNILAPIFFAVFVYMLISLSYKTRSLFLILCTLTFLIKLMRAELYAAFITLLLGPLMFYFAHKIITIFLTPPRLY